MGNLAWIILVVVIFAWYAFVIQKAATDKNKCGFPLVKNNPREHNKINKDMFLENVQKYAENSQNEVKALREKHKAELNQKYSEDLKLKNMLSEFAKKQGLDRALIAIWKEIEHYPSWSKQDDFNKYSLLDLKNIKNSENESNRDRVKSILFEWQGEEYEVKCKEMSLFCSEEKHAYFTLIEQGEVRFKISTSMDDDEYGSSYRCFAVDAFKRKGNWYKFILDAWKTILIKKDEHSIDFRYTGADKIKNNFED